MFVAAEAIIHVLVKIVHILYVYEKLMLMSTQNRCEEYDNCLLLFNLKIFHTQAELI